MIVRRSALTLAFSLLLPLDIFSANPASQSAELARVAILEFQDNTGQPSYGWVKKSLPDAINDSMKQHFEFARADSSAAEKNSDKILGYAKQYTPEMAEQLAKDYQFDIVIFGDYTYDQKSKLARIEASVYHLKARRIIGKVSETTKLNNDVFTKIDLISKKIVEYIYRFSLDLSDEAAARKREEGIRLLVLVPTWTTEAQKRTAMSELDIQKRELKKKYQAEFLTIFEFFAKRKTPPAEQKNVENLAKSRNDAGIAEWLRQQKVTNAMIVFVSENKVSLRPVVEGESKAPVTYSVNATPAEKAKSIDNAVNDSGMRDNLTKTSITREPAIWGKTSLAVGSYYLVPVGSGSDKIYPAMGIELHGLYRIWHAGFLQLGAVANLAAAQQTHLLNTGEDDLLLRHLTAVAGPAVMFPLPFYRPVEVHAAVLAGTTYASLQKYKYSDLTLTFSALSPAVAVQAEVRWHIWRGVFVAPAIAYQRVFYSGTDMHFVTANIRAGYRF